MKRSQYGHSWMIVTYGDNEECGFCSVHCAAVDMAVHIDRPLNGVTVGDYDSKKQIDAEKGFLGDRRRQAGRDDLEGQMGL